MFLNQIIINFNDGTDVLTLKRNLKFLQKEKRKKLEKSRHFGHYPLKDLLKFEGCRGHVEPSLRIKRCSFMMLLLLLFNVIYHLITHFSSPEKPMTDGIVLKDSWTHLTPSQNCPACSLHVPSASHAGFSYVCVSEGSCQLHGQLLLFPGLLITIVHYLICFHVNTHKMWCLFRISFVKQLGMEK